LKTLHLTRMSLPKIAVLATGLTAAILVGTMSPQAAQAHPNYASTCVPCHDAGGSVAANPSSATLAPGAAYTVALTFTGGTSPVGYWISGNGASVFGSDAGPAPMTAPAAAGSYTYTVWMRSGVAATTTYSITVAAASTSTTTTAPAASSTTTTAPAASSTTTTAPAASSTTTTTAPAASSTTTTAPAASTTTTAPAAAAGPGTPTDVTAVRGDRQATVSWKAPTTGDSPIAGYAVIPSGRPDLMVLTDGPETSATVTGLTNGTSYTFTVVAADEAGLYSADSVPSNAVTPLGASTAVTPVVAGASAVIPVGAPNTGAGGASGSTNGPLAGLGGLALLLAGAGATQIIRRRQQV
jgi:hypothetical protein